MYQTKTGQEKRYIDDGGRSSQQHLEIYRVSGNSYLVASRFLAIAFWLFQQNLMVDHSFDLVHVTYY